MEGNRQGGGGREREGRERGGGDRGKIGEGGREGENKCAMT